MAEDNGQDLWSNFVVVAAAEKVRAAIVPFDRVYLTQINTANEVVIAGDPGLCQQVIDALGCQGFRAPFNYVMHCQAMASEHAELAQMNTMPLKSNLAGHAKLYSTATYEPMDLESQRIGERSPPISATRLIFPAWSIRSTTTGPAFSWRSGRVRPVAAGSAPTWLANPTWWPRSTGAVPTTKSQSFRR
ncbi:MAG: hypothetical protein HC771_03185 [Synechococcales cyanobacterium CRU_2_2]|nr:hypothetical protein [Synechococcales cyanobacterium CRU_2_2]